MIGKTLSHYKVIEKIGQGGMGEVYRAEDTNLNREVAIKVLPEQFTQDPQRLARFEREAKLLASLNHPNIAAIHSFEHSDEIHFLVLELVPGETLAERVAKGPLPVEEVLEVCRQIAEGVEAAHEKGVIHRDLKPANVKVTPEGKVKILDFGLAKAFEVEPAVTDMSQSPTLTEEMTRAGVILGTAAYMSPEQAKGKPVDKRADVFAFGAVLYELLTGKRAFEGETITETIAKVLESEPNWEVLPGATPWRIGDLLRQCLQKNPQERLHDIANLRIGIKQALSEPSTIVPTEITSTTRTPLWKSTIPWSIAAVALVIAGVAVWSLRDPSPRSVTKLVIAPAPTTPLANSTGSEVAISPDGRQIIYLAESDGVRKLYRRSMDDLMAMEVPGTEGAGTNPFFSPDGESIAFVVDGKLKRVPLMGGPAITLADLPTSQSVSGDWGPEDTIVFAGMSSPGRLSLHRISGVGGEPEILAVPDFQKGEYQYRDPEILPDGSAVLFTVWSREGLYTAALSLETGEQKIIIEGGRSPRYMVTGHLVYELSGTGTLMVVLFDPDRLEVRGDPVPFLEGVRYTRVSGADFTISNEGTLAYIPGDAGSRSLVWVDHEGKSTLLMERQGSLELPRVSVDGQRMAVTSEYDIFIYNQPREVLSPLTGEWFNHAQTWSPDSSRVAFSSTKDGGEPNIFWVSPDGGEEWERLSSSPNEQYPGSFSPDGEILAFTEVNPSTGRDIWLLPMESNGSPQSFLSTAAHEWEPRFAPNGQLIAYTSDESGQNEVYVRPYPAGPGEWQISNQGGRDPLWAPDGRTLFYRNGPKMMAVAVDTEPTFRPGRPSLLFEGEYALHPPGFTNHDISPDGRQFLMIKDDRVSEQAQINVVLNWFEELKRLVPTN